MNISKRLIALYLPQFHPIPENDKWWGKGFTEWTNVTKAQPLFAGHYQPQLPTETGFYDLRVSEVMEQQAEMASQYGINGFCYYHYWFSGHRLLEMPVDNMLKNKKITFPFMLCWANENWTRVWDGMDKEVLIEQRYSKEDDIAHIKHLIPYFKDERYIKVDNKAVFVIYKHFLLPDPSETAKTWREVAKLHGIDLYLCHMAFGYKNDNQLASGFDAVIDFEPFGIRHKDIFQHIMETFYQKNTLRERIKKKIRKIFQLREETRYNIADYSFYQDNMVSLKKFNYKLYPSLVPGWDNSPRRQHSPTLILKDGTPELFASWLKKIDLDFEPYSPEENFIFINAWNEWAEGNHLEPCRKFGKAYLEAIQNYRSKNK